MKAKVEDRIVFTARDGDWFVAKGLDAGHMSRENVAHFLAALSNTVSRATPRYLTEVIDVNGIRGLADEITVLEIPDRVKVIKSAKTSRKLGSLIKEDDKKLRKLLIDVARGVLVSEALDILYPEDELKGNDVEPRFEGRHVDFTAKHGSWIVVKRLIIDEKTRMIDVAYVLASINETAFLKFPEYAGIDSGALLRELGISGRKIKASEIPETVSRLLSLDVSFYAPPEFREHARVHAFRLLLNAAGLPAGVPFKPLKKYVEKAPD